MIIVYGAVLFFGVDWRIASVNDFPIILGIRIANIEVRIITSAILQSTPKNSTTPYTIIMFTQRMILITGSR
jgi:hypothetical protein